MSLTGINKHRDSFNTAKKKYRLAILRHHPNKGGSNNNARRVLAEWNEYQRHHQQGPSRSAARTPNRPPPRAASPARPSAPNFSRSPRNNQYVPPHYPKSFVPEFIGCRSRYNARTLQQLAPRFTMADSLGKVLTSLELFARIACPALFHGFHMTLACLDYSRENRVARQVKLNSRTHRNTRLASLLPGSQWCDEVILTVIVPPTPPNTLPQRRRNNGTYFFF